MKREGLALLEVLVALVILSLLVVGYLRLFQGSHRLVARSREWSEATAAAAEAMEWVKLQPPALPSDRMEVLPGQLRRRITTAPWRPGLAVVKVTVTLRTGGQIDVYRLTRMNGVADSVR